MMHSLQQAALTLREHYGVQPLPGEPGLWSTLVKLVVARGLPPNKMQECWERLEDSPLRSAAATLEANATEIAECLESLGRAAQSAAALQAAAGWWVERGGTAAEPASSEWLETLAAADLESLRSELRAIRGVSVELADRIVLFVCGRNVFPIDRATLRVACRHGWLGPEAGYDEWQDLFVRGQRDDSASLAQLSLQIARVGKDFCGLQPKCERCPLRPLLPPGGPYGDE